MDKLTQMAQCRLQRLDAGEPKDAKPQSIYACFERFSPHLEPPRHLDPYVELLHQAIREGSIEAVVHAPPQHGKTETAKHAFVFAAIARPGKRHNYSTYNDFRALSIRNQVARLAQEAGLDPHTRDSELALAGGTLIQFVGTGGSLTGFPCDGVHICDDPIKDRAEASSKVIKDAKWD